MAKLRYSSALSFRTFSARGVPSVNDELRTRRIHRRRTYLRDHIIVEQQDLQSRTRFLDELETLDVLLVKSHLLERVQRTVVVLGATPQRVQRDSNHLARAQERIDDDEWFLLFCGEPPARGAPTYDRKTADRRSPRELTAARPDGHFKTST
jgi:hypothetical protein